MQHSNVFILQIVSQLKLKVLKTPWVIQACSLHDKDSIVKGFDSYNKLLIAARNGAGEFDQI